MQTIVIKVGTQVVTDEGSVNHAIIAHLVGDIERLMTAGYAVALVSSGAVGAGRSVLGGLPPRVDEVSQRQIYSAVGQIELMGAYRELFAQRNKHSAQVLATRSDFRDRHHYLNMQRCITALLKQGIVPIVNENDAVAVSELMFTDNDELAGLLAAMLNAHALFLLSNVDGVYTADDTQSKQIVAQWNALANPQITTGNREKSAFGRGGMHTKVRVALRAASLGIETWVANGRTAGIVPSLLADGGLGTHFPARRRASPMKRWVAAGSGHEKGRVVINDGAIGALRDPQRLTSLLPVGVTRVDGEFAKGDILRIESSDGVLIGFGRAQYGCDTARNNVGQRGTRALVHYDYLYLEQP